MATEAEIQRIKEIVSGEGEALAGDVGNNAESSDSLTGATPDPAPSPEPDASAGEESPPEYVPFRPELPKESKEFAELARRERLAREVADENKRLEQQLKEAQELVGSRPDQEAIRAEAQQDPLGFIKKYGISYEDLTNTILNNDVPTQDIKIRNEVEGLRAEVQSMKNAKKAENEARKREEQEQAYNKFIDEINDFVENNSSDCELIKLQNAQQLVGEVIRDNYAATGRAMPYNQACRIVEEHLEKQVRSAMRSSRFTPKQSAPEVAPPVAEEITSTKPKTLTNENMASPAHVGDGSNRPRQLSRDESLEKLASMNFWG